MSSPIFLVNNTTTETLRTPVKISTARTGKNMISFVHPPLAREKFTCSCCLVPRSPRLFQLCVNKQRKEISHLSLRSWFFRLPLRLVVVLDSESRPFKPVSLLSLTMSLTKYQLVIIMMMNTIMMTMMIIIIIIIARDKRNPQS